MKMIFGIVSIGIALIGGTANAAGCVKGAAVGAVAGHVAGHHAVVGAVGGCLVGRHMAKEKAKQEKEAAQVKKEPRDSQTTPAK